MILYKSQYEMLKRFGNTIISSDIYDCVGSGAIKKDIYDKIGMKVKITKIMNSLYDNTRITFKADNSGYHYIIEEDK